MKNSIKLLYIFQIISLLTVIFDIVFFRQVVVFIYLTFIPGFIILNLLKFDLKNGLDTILFSVGLSVTFLMFIGLFINEFYPLIGISKPLSTPPLFITISIILFISFIYSSKINKPKITFSFPNLNQILKIIPIIIIPLLAIYGAFINSNIILLLMVALISIIVLISIYNKKLIPYELHQIVIYIISISLIFHIQFISNYITGWDVFGEIFVFRIAYMNSLWDYAYNLSNNELQNYNSILSTTILPTIYAKLLNIEGELVFKYIYAILFSLIPITLYRTYFQIFDKPTAFLSVFYFMLFPRFYNLSARKQWIGELFFSLLIYLIVNKKIKTRKKNILFIAFSAALILSHYSVTYIYLFLIFTTWISTYFLEKYIIVHTRKLITGTYVMLLGIMVSTWYIFVSTSPYITYLELINRIYNSFISDFFNLESRGYISGVIYSEYYTRSSIRYIDYWLNKLPYLFIFIGIIYLFKNNKDEKFNLEYSLMSMANIVIIFLVIFVPYLSPAFKADRFYHVTLFCLAPICILGGKSFFTFILKPFSRISVASKIIKKGLGPMCCLLIIIFLFKIGFIYEAFGDVPTSAQISFSRMSTSNDDRIQAIFYNKYVPEQDVYSSIWLNRMTSDYSNIYADRIASKHVLRGQGIYVSWDYYLWEFTIIEKNSYIYLRYYDVVRISKEFVSENISHQINYKTNKIYSNGYSEIYRSFPVNE